MTKEKRLRYLKRKYEHKIVKPLNYEYIKRVIGTETFEIFLDQKLEQPFIKEHNLSKDYRTTEHFKFVI